MIARWGWLITLLLLPQAALAATVRAVPGTTSGHVGLAYSIANDPGDDVPIASATASLAGLSVEVERGDTGELRSVEIRLAEPLILEGDDGGRIEVLEIVAGSVETAGAGLGQLTDCGVTGSVDGMDFATDAPGSCGAFAVTTIGDVLGWEWILDESWSLTWTAGESTFRLELHWVGPIGGLLEVPEPAPLVLLTGAALFGRWRRRVWGA